MAVPNPAATARPTDRIASERRAPMAPARPAAIASSILVALLLLIGTWAPAARADDAVAQPSEALTPADSTSAADTTAPPEEAAATNAVPSPSATEAADTEGPGYAPSASTPETTGSQGPEEPPVSQDSQSTPSAVPSEAPADPAGEAVQGATAPDPGPIPADEGSDGSFYVAGPSATPAVTAADATPGVSTGAGSQPSGGFADAQLPLDPPGDPPPSPNTQQPEVTPAPADQPDPPPPPAPEPPVDAGPPPGQEPEPVPEPAPPSDGAGSGGTDSGGDDAAAKHFAADYGPEEPSPVASQATGPPGPSQGEAAGVLMAEEAPPTDFTVGTEPMAEDTSFAVDTALASSGGIRIVRSMGSFVLVRTTRPVVQREAQARASGRAPEASGIGGFSGGEGPPIPGLFLSLAGGGGGGGVILVLVGVLAVLTGTIVRVPQNKRAFLLPVATWRPSAYVTPIELPG